MALEKSKRPAIVILIALGAIGMTIVVIYMMKAANEWIVTEQSRSNLREVRYYLLELMKDQGTSTPTFPDSINYQDDVPLESGRYIKLKDLLTDPHTGNVFIYRTITSQGEHIVLDPSDQKPGERFIIWSPKSDYDGKRMVMTDSLLIELVSDKLLDFDTQTIQE